MRVGRSAPRGDRLLACASHAVVACSLHWPPACSRVCHGVTTRPPVLESKCDYRVEECLTMARVLSSMNTGGWWCWWCSSPCAWPGASAAGLLLCLSAARDDPPPPRVTVCGCATLTTGADIANLQLSGPAEPAAAFRGLLDMDRLSVMGHSCGGATAAAAAAAHAGVWCMWGAALAL
jgi:hypothetical protein